MRCYTIFFIILSLFIYINKNIYGGNNKKNTVNNKTENVKINANNITEVNTNAQVNENKKNTKDNIINENKENNINKGDKKNKEVIVSKESNEGISSEGNISIKNNDKKEEDKTLLKNNDQKTDIPDDFLSDIDENFNMFYESNKQNIRDNIPFTISTYKEFINFNLYVRKKNEVPNTYNKSILTLLKMSSSSIDILFKLRSVHNKIWGSLENKHPKNKFVKYVKSHFEPSIGLFYENNSHSNYYKMIVKSKNNDDMKKDITVDVSTKILRIGPIFKLTWFIDDTRKFNSSFMISVGWQTNLYWNKCCCHYKDVWLTTRTEYGGFDDKGYSECTTKKSINILPVYLMLHLDFGYYFFKLYIRFYSPISKQDNITHQLYTTGDKKYNYFDSKNTTINESSNERKLILNKWTMAFGGSLTL